MKPFLVVCLFLLASCGGPLSLLTGGGPNVAANVQAGKNNNQTLGQTQTREIRQVVESAQTVQQSTNESVTQLKSDKIETVTIVQQVSGWWIILFLLWSLFLFWLPSPNQIGEAFARWVRSTRKV